MVIPPFATSRLPDIVFGPGRLAELPALCRRFGRRLLLVSGAHSLRASAHWPRLVAGLRAAGLSWEELAVAGEPSPQGVDEAVARWRDAGIETVLGIGGGSVLDAAKAIAGLLRVQRSVMDFLEGVGPELPYEGPALPFIAVPTTAGTGSEATKNAVLSVQGAGGFKKSFRHERLVARYAVVDPDLLAGCPPEIIAANGMDALTQLIESYVSTRAHPVSDALALSGLEAARDGLLPWYEGREVEAARGRMAYAALVSGITLAQAGLGSVHGLASPLGAYFPIPHGVACGTLLAAATAVNLRALRAREPSSPALAKYARLATLLTGRSFADDAAAHEALIAQLEDWTARLTLPGLARYGIGRGDFGRLVAGCRGSSMKTNPIVLTDDEVREILAARS
jgi:alcohol dehydrogenase